MFVEGISGTLLSALKDENAIKELLKDLNVEKALHQKMLTAHLQKLIEQGPGGGNAANNGDIPYTGNIANPLDSCKVEVNDRVTVSPRTIMKRLFDIQGIALDPDNIEATVVKIKKVVGKGFGVGNTKYDCFINYRVDSEHETAEKLWLYLKTEGIHAYLDKRCLKDGMKWKDGFLNGLMNSRVFIALISSGALARVRDFKQDHTYDNVLLEYETALKVSVSCMYESMHR